MTGDINHALFEGLFRRALTPDAALEGALKACGYDLRRPVDRYSGQVFAACLEATRAHLHPDQPAEEGLRALGRAFVSGFQQTILGKVVTTALPILGPARFLPRLPARFRSIRTDASVAVELTGPASATLMFTDAQPLGPFFAGVIEAALRLAKAERPVVALQPAPDGYRLDVSW
ncbi:MAG: DUF2378 family protein [Myxococcaceae bacterium]|nr:DUF2378 family protein [Myxococcaceae bacterium]